MEEYRAHIIYKTLGKYVEHHYEEFSDTYTKTLEGDSIRTGYARHDAERYAEKVVKDGFWLTDRITTHPYTNVSLKTDDVLVPPSCIKGVFIEPIEVDI